HLKQRYPLFHSTLKEEVVNGYSLIYKWQGSDANLQPIALLAHQDVVPISPGTENKWEVAPFDGVVKDGYVWGRGAWDNKSNLITQHEAVESLLKSGFKPKRTVYFVFGADEEVSGLTGAKSIAKLFSERGIHFEYVLDEGLLIMKGAMPGVKAPTALIGIAEKGYLTLKLEVDATPGHSSMPPAKGTSAIAQLSAALVKLDNHPMPGEIQGVVAQMLDAVTPEMSGSMRVIMSNLWLFGPIVKSQFEKKGSTNAMLRTTTALTIISGGDKENVLPGHAEATVNFRLLPGDTDETVINFVQRTIQNDNIKVTALEGYSKPSKVSSIESRSYQAIGRTVRELFKEAVVVPGLMVAATDSRYMDDVSDNVFRFSPVTATNEDLTRFHGTNERISVENLGQMVKFYYRLLELTAGE
ncbi:MAG: M20 family peptidase, partial [Leptonema sp. (in: Bacteria)]|nr:M20 family peptidase [Leptonema sp. (in: bacteria)]